MVALRTAPRAQSHPVLAPDILSRPRLAQFRTGASFCLTILAEARLLQSPVTFNHSHPLARPNILETSRFPIQIYYIGKTGQFFDEYGYA